MGKSDEQLQQALASLRARDQAQRQAILAYGVDLGKERQIDLSFWANTRADADSLRDALERNGLANAKVLSPVPGQPQDSRWLVTASLAASVDFITALDNVTTFILVADKYDCDYDGWGTAIVEAANPPQ